MDYFLKIPFLLWFTCYFVWEHGIKLKEDAVRKQERGCGGTSGEGTLAWLVTGEEPFPSSNMTYTAVFPQPRDYNQNFLMGDIHTVQFRQLYISNLDAIRKTKVSLKSGGLALVLV